MKNYSIDTNARHKIYFPLALLSVGIAFSLLPITDLLGWLVFKYVAAPDVMLNFGILVKLFDQYLWKDPWFNWLTDIPILDGRWKGTIKRKGINGQPDAMRDVVVTITQTWLTMNIVFEGENSKSTSEVISLYIADKKQICLKWIYLAEGKGKVEENLYGEGTTKVSLKAEGGKRQLAGRYYSSKLRQGYLELNEDS